MVTNINIQGRNHIAHSFSSLQLNEAFTALFVVEMVIKLGLLGPHTYLRDGYNVFDFAITWLGLVEITVQVGQFDFAATLVVPPTKVRRLEDLPQNIEFLHMEL